MTAEFPFEYTQQVCDLWQMHHLASEFGYKGWEAVGVVNVNHGMKVANDVRQPDGPEYVAVNPVAVLFRRPWSATAECDEETWSLDHFNAEQADGYWIRCDLLGPHDKHKDKHTGLTWKTTTEEKP